jgi:hypothetical protein
VTIAAQVFNFQNIFGLSVGVNNVAIESIAGKSLGPDPPKKNGTALLLFVSSRLEEGTLFKAESKARNTRVYGGART